MNTYLHSHQQAKKLNNTAALCIETGHYKRGISCLVEALQLSDKQNVPQHLFFKPNDMVSPAVCQCKHCSLDECIVFSERTPLNSITSNLNTVDETIDHIANNGYIHRRPIRITPQSSQEGHNMGVTLSLIITFNLALAHHLSALSTFSLDQNDDNCIHKNHVLDSSQLLRKSPACKETFQKILYLYELAYRWQIELDESRILKLRQVQQQQQEMSRSSWNFDNTNVEMDASPVTSLRFNMIICNNLSQIHQLVQNHSKRRRCLEHLLATIMFVVVTDGTQQHWRGHSLPSPSMSSSNTNLTTSAISSTTNTQRQHQHEYMDLEGFLFNVSQGILQGACAGAA